MSDQWLARGLRARRRIARHGVDVASLEGLGGLSIGHHGAPGPTEHTARLPDIPEPRADDLKPFLGHWSPYCPTY
ncbi:hypothetical protein AB0D13_19625 [Streptomyces sp. NPDC048430]|uniref:hypothetical protein n=1 Tax=unclassified Streptomyces TaxID=2593676 RepID=UPI00342DDFB9